MQKRFSCPSCLSFLTIKKGKRRGKERRLCLSCGKWFSINRKRSTDFKPKDLANLHLNGVSFRKIADECRMSAPTVFRKVNEYLSHLPTNADITRAYCSRFSGILVLDGKYIPIRNYRYRIPLIWGIDYLTHDIPHFKLAPSENYQSSIVYFQTLRLLNYPLQCLVVDDNVNFKMAALRIYPKVVIQTCTNHFKENVRRNLKVRSDEKYRPFMDKIEFIFSKKRSIQEYEKLAGTLYQSWKYDELACGVLAEMSKREGEFLAYLKVPRSPQTTNLIESYNSHLNSRLTSLKSFETFESARIWLNGYILKRRLTKLKGCAGQFKKLNGYPSLFQTLQDNLSLPNFF